MISYNFNSILVTFLALCMGLTLAACGGEVQPEPTTPVVSAATATPEPEPEPLETETAGSEGQEQFTQICAACHGPDGAGLPNLGKDLIESEFVGGLTDEQLLDYIKTGRGVDDPLNTTGVAMPPNGGRPDMSDDELFSIIAYMRVINTKAGADSAEATQYLAQLEAGDSAETKETDANEAETDTDESEEADSDESEADANGAETDTDESEEADSDESEADASVIEVKGDVEAGQHLFAEVCAPCHSLQATGIQGIGLDLTESEFIGSLTPTQLADFITMGRGLNNPFNVTDVRMPPKGGRAKLSDDDVLNISTYLHSINTQVGIESGSIAKYLDWLESGGSEEIEVVEEISSIGLSGAALDGQTTYFRFCAVCHGPQGEGVVSLGKSLIGSNFITELGDDQVILFIKTGRPANHPLNTTGIEMLPYGGQESLSNEELTNLVTYLRVVNASEVTLAAKPADVEEEEEEEEEEEDETHEVAEEIAFAIIDNTLPNCFVCHRISERGNKNGPGPNLNDLSSQADDRIPGMSAQEYVKQSILNPSDFIVPECPAGPCVDAMPKNFKDQLSDEDLETLITFLLSLPE